MVEVTKGGGFYGAKKADEDCAQLDEALRVEGLGQEIALMRVGLRTVTDAEPIDWRMVTVGVSVLVRAVATQYRVSPKAREDLSNNVAALLNSLGDQILPADWCLASRSRGAAFLVNAAPLRRSDGLAREFRTFVLNLTISLLTARTPVLSSFARMFAMSQPLERASPASAAARRRGRRRDLRPRLRAAFRARRRARCGTWSATSARSRAGSTD